MKKTATIGYVFILMILLASCGSSSKDGNSLESSSITSIDPAEAKVGDMITISGEGFGSEQNGSELSIGGVTATDIISWSGTEINATVPAGAHTGDVTVTINGVRGTSAQLIVPWSAKNPDNVAISVETSYQQAQKLISDGRGGSIIVWADRRNGSDYDIYAQRVNSAGEVQWTANGVAISTETGNQINPALTSDGCGGALIAWPDARGGSYDIYVQHINSDGVVQLATNGVAVCDASGSQTGVQLLPDGNGGAYIGWVDGRSDSGDTYIQYINGNGVSQWTTNGVAIAVKDSIQGAPLMTRDDSEGVIVVWHDGRSGAIGIYAQRINNAGEAEWTKNGVPIVTWNGGQEYQQIISDGNGGAIVVWRAWPGADYDIYAQRIDVNGTVQWAADGVAVSAAGGYQDYPTITDDGSGGAIIAWQDSRNGAQYADEDIYAQRINGAGELLWSADGVAICTVSGVQRLPQIISDGDGGAIMSWLDWRDSKGDIFAQRINSAGEAQWSDDGVAIRSASNSVYSQDIIGDGYGGAILSWQDRRNEAAEGDIYAQGITAGGLQ